MLNVKVSVVAAFKLFKINVHARKRAVVYCQ